MSTRLIIVCDGCGRRIEHNGEPAPWYRVYAVGTHSELQPLDPRTGY